MMETPCIACGRTDVRKRPRAGKQRFPHKCPHGVWCVAGVLNQGFNGPLLGGPNYCAACVERARKARFIETEIS